jgi:hypothetical protein
MKHKQRLYKSAAGLLAVVAVAMMAPAFASAHTGEWARFNYCPSTTTGVFKCINSLTTGGKVALGSKNVPIVNTVTLQGGFEKPNAETGMANFVGATNGETLQKVPQPVPGGLAGLVNCKEISNIILRASCELTFENGLTGVNATLELAKPASQIKISELHLVSEELVALELPVRVHLENPFLGSECYVGSSSSPLIWKLTTGASGSLHGASGEVEFLEEGRILELKHSKQVDNTWSAPGANGCGGIFSFILDPILNLDIGLPAGSGGNAAVLETTSWVATATAVNAH